MTSEPDGLEHNAEIIPLRAAEVASIPEVAGNPGPGTAAYADITAPGGRKPVLPHWMHGREAFRNAAKVRAGHVLYLARFHVLRLPWYAAVTVFWGVAGTGRLAARWVRWWLFPVPRDVYAAAVADGHTAWHRTHAVHKVTSRNRAVISGVVIAAAAIGGVVAWHHARWVLVLAGAVTAAGAAAFGRPAGVRIVTRATIPQQYEALTLDVVTRALGSVGLAGINQWLREGREIDYTTPVKQDGPGYRVRMNLPYGTTAAQVIDRRSQFASGLRRPLGAVWPEPVTEEHEGALDVWVGQQDVSKAKAPAWPLLKSGTVDVFKPFPFAADVRGRRVLAPLMYTNWLIGSIPRQGKTATVRVLACGVALDPLAEQWIHELKGTGDLDPLEKVCQRFVSGIDDDSIAYAAESLRLLRAEIGKRSPRIKALDTRICPEKRVTREIAAKRPLRLWPVICTVDECQNLFAHPKFGKQAGEDAEFIIKVGPAMGVVLILATQRPDKDSLPKGISANVGTRFCLHVTGQIENDMILGTSAYKNGIRATLFRPETDAGLGYLKGATPAPKVCRTYFLDVPAAQSVTARARAARERAGTLPATAAGQDSTEPERDVLADVLTVFGTDTGLHWTVLAGRLAQRWPDRWAGVTGDALSAQMRPLGVRSVQVNRGGQNLQGCRRATLEALQT